MIHVRLGLHELLCHFYTIFQEIQAAMTVIVMFLVYWLVG